MSQWSVQILKQWTNTAQNWSGLEKSLAITLLANPHITHLSLAFPGVQLLQICFYHQTKLRLDWMDMVKIYLKQTRKQNKEKGNLVKTAPGVVTEVIKN